MTAIVIGRFGPEALEAVQRAVARGSATPAVFREVDAARERMTTRTPTPRCVFLEAGTAGAPAFVAWIRGEARFFSVPLVLMVPPIDDAAYTDAHALGADDVIAVGDTDGIRRRLLNLVDFDPDVRPPITEGTVVIAHADLARRRILGRTLRQAGFDVMFASNTAELLALGGGREAPRLAVMASQLPPSGAFDALKDLRAVSRLPNLPAVVLASTVDRTNLCLEALRVRHAVVTNETAPPHNLVFLANELLRPDFRELRGAPRILYGTLCGFRRAGELAADHGLTYNLSREGLYVRTLDPPAAGTERWIELRPPKSAAAVHLRARVVWAWRYGMGGGAPPGFGVRIVPEACPPWDLQAYWDSYDRLSSEPRQPL
jgi:CheY-like chemotaxis protein